MKQLLVAYAFPPRSSPEAYLNAKYIRHFKKSEWETDILTVENDTSFDTIDPFLLKVMENTVIKRFHIKSYEKRYWYRILSKLFRFFCTIPDSKITWALQRLPKIDWTQYDVIHSRSNYLSSHLLALRIHKKTNTPWVAHFSDPWVDNPYRMSSLLSEKTNIIMERKVISSAKALIFTSPETKNICMRKYPKSFLDKSYDIPHGFEPDWYPKKSKRIYHSQKIIVRYIGYFYRDRNPYSLIRAFGNLYSRNKALAEKFKFEFVGEKFDPAHISFPQWKDFFYMLPPVDYQESLNLMQSSNLLLLIDAPAKESIFLPSKLIDYLGANRPVFGITHLRGASYELIKKLNNCFLCEPDNVEQITSTLKRIALSDLSISDKNVVPQDIYRRYTAEAITKRIVEVLNKVVV